MSLRVQMRAVVALSIGRAVIELWLGLGILRDTSPRCKECETLEIDHQFLKVSFSWGLYPRTRIMGSPLYHPFDRSLIPACVKLVKRSSRKSTRC